MKARFAEVPEAVQNTLEVAEKCNVEIEFNKLHYPVFTPPEHFTREGYLRKLLGEGLKSRYGLHVRVEEEKFLVDALDDLKLLPTYRAPEETTVPDAALPASAAKPDLGEPAVAEA